MISTVDIRTIATEILRTNACRPGLLAVDGGRLKLTPSLNNDKEGEDRNNSAPGQKVLNAVDDFNRALNACIQAEKEYFSRVRSLVFYVFFHYHFYLNFISLPASVFLSSTLLYSIYSSISYIYFILAAIDR